ncbi:DnaJ domain-containing protein [Rhizobiaceae bacterium BDR2-2]|uniref:DnaJ domain-containing protein n=1 Tax=Ectorhizobium quercum TaxID=2965071 RepID=A0AAE3MY17_9HYPH|nr:DnaJ C-terminal domain-containing protein [Ectorhizobium quercum]MCX8996376.1 DnaJ domain-containing protein [Ectorhizobium quercum]MCX8998585.1 DnaJ domain-containing protein [Ectorhizobium quercum]
MAVEVSVATMRDPYTVLGVRQDAQDEEIKAAWRARVKSVHPDHNRDDPQAAARFAEIGAAYELLRDPQKRNRYDARHGKADGDGETIMQKRQAAREAAERAHAAREEAARVMEELARANAQRAAQAARETSGATSDDSAEAMVNRIFGTGEKAGAAGAAQDTAPKQDAAPQQGAYDGGAGPADATTETTQTSSPEETEAGRASSAPLSVQAIDLISYWIRRLRGIEPVPEKAPDIVTDVTVSIDDLIAGRKVYATLFDGREVRVQLEPGMTRDHVVRIEGQGHRFQGMQRGDVRVTLKIAPDPRFDVEGFDIHTVLPVTLENAVLGCESTVESPEGPVAISIPPWSDSNRSIRIEGQGLPETEDRRGDLVVELRLVLWEKPDDKVTDLMRHMREGLYI